MNDTNNSKKIDVLLHISKIFSEEVSHFTQRIDKIRGIYLTALFGLIAILLNPNVKPLTDILKSIRSDNTQIFLILLLPILNSIFLIYIISYMHFIYSAAKYNSFYIGGLLSRELETNIIPFDNWETIVGDKEAWVTTRSMIGVMTFIIATAMSIMILYSFSNAGRLTNGILDFIIYCFAIETVSLSIVVAVVHNHIGKRYHVSEISSKSTGIRRWYWFSIPLGVLIYVLITWIL